MAKRKIVEVDEEQLQRMIAGDVPLFKPEETAHTKEVGKEPEPEEEEEKESIPAAEPELVTTRKKKKSQQPDFSETFLKNEIIKDRRQIYISKDAYDKISGYIRHISGGKVSLVSYVNNILMNHMEEYKETINEMYDRNICKPL